MHVLWKIKIITKDLKLEEIETLIFAGEELKKYLSKISEDEIILTKTKEWDKTGIAIGVNLSSDMPSVEDPVLDDGILISVNNRNGVISGVNPRATLIAVYRYLKELGFVFLRPGKNGEIIPKSFAEKDVFVKEVPSYRLRGICFEGSVFYSCLEELIDWMPKAGMNIYTFQFFVPVPFYKRWYGREEETHKNPYIDSADLSYEEFEGMVNMHINQLKKRGIIYKNGGHGITMGGFDIPSGIGVEEAKPYMTEEFKESIALIDGKRKIQKHGLLFTQLCYSKPNVRSRMANFVVNYCKNHPELDALGVSFSDGVNNHCECEECVKKNISDWFVMLLNEIDEKLTALGLKTKIGFSMYMHTLWPPTTERIKNENRFIPTFCPFARHYNAPLTLESDYEMASYEHNKVLNPKDPKALAPYLKAWQEAYNGKMYVFDYYFMHDFFHELSTVLLTDTIYTDTKNYKDLDLHGHISCQSQRTFAPTSLAMNVMSRTLWNRAIDFETEKKAILECEFGADYNLVYDYLKMLSKYEPKEEIWHFRESFQSEENASNCELGKKLISDFLPIIKEHILSVKDALEKDSWQNLKFHAEYTYMVLDIMSSLAKGIKATEKIEEFRDFINKKEWEFRQYFDIALIKEAVLWRLGKFNSSIENKK